MNIFPPHVMPAHTTVIRRVLSIFQNVFIMCIVMKVSDEYNRAQRLQLSGSEKPEKR